MSFIPCGGCPRKMQRLQPFGKMMENIEGGSKNRKAALDWYTKAAAKATVARLQTKKKS